ncbi:MAG: (d)CMP kinase [Flavobacteriales bacterium]|nr:(d)CMP kinase [Flavobacteriales bacterium]
MDIRINIAIDGHSSCGKSTIAKAIAKKFGMRYIDTGAMYRVITLYCIENKIINNGEVDIKELILHLPKINVSFEFNVKSGKSETILNRKNVESEIRKHEVSSFVSIVSQIKEVREKLVVLQREIGKKKGVVMDGRDIGTKVFPNAELKFFITANAEIRAQRRFSEIRKTGVSLQQVFENLLERDETDSNREINPLKVAQDAIVIDNSDLTEKQQNNLIFELIKKKIESND